MEKNYIALLYDNWLKEMEEPQNVIVTLDAFNDYLQELQKKLTQKERNILGNYNGSCIVAYEEFAFYAGFQTACELFRLLRKY